MINVIINEAGGTITVRGHAEFDDNGHDLVCAGISALTWALAASLQRCGALNYVEEDEGDMLINFKHTEGAHPHIDYYRNGVDLLSIRYPENVQVQGSEAGQ